MESEMKKVILNYFMIFVASLSFLSCQKSADEYYNSGIALSKEHKIESSIDAINCFDSAIEASPNFALAYLDRGRTRFAIENIRNIFSKNGKYSNELNKEFNRLESDSLFKIAIIDYNKALELDATLGKEVLTAKGYIFIVLDDFKKALIHFEKALEIDSTNKSLIYSIVTSKLSLKDTLGAKLFLSKIIDYNHNDSEVFYLRAVQRLVSLNNKVGGCEDLKMAKEMYDSSANYIHENLIEKIEKLISINCKM